MNQNSFLREACVESLEQAIAAETKGADQLELCSSLNQEGLTPEKQLVKLVLENVHIPVKVMARPQNTFTINEHIFQEIKLDIDKIHAENGYGIVFGYVKNGKLDLDYLKPLIESSRGLDITIHKAIDHCENIVEEVERLNELNVPLSILSSGGEKDAITGIHVLKEMLEVASENITIIPAGSITDENIDHIHAVLNARIYHGRKIV